MICLGKNISVSYKSNVLTIYISCADPEGGGVRKPLESHKTIGFLRNTSPSPLENHKATKPAFKVGPASVRQRNDIKWRFAGGPMLAIILLPVDYRK